LNTQKAKQIVMVTVMLAVAVLLNLCITAASIVQYGQKDETRKADVAVVLGAAAYDNGISPVYEERIRHAIELYREGYVDKILVTGGTAEGNHRSDAEAAKAFAMEEGVPEDVILTEENSSITEENLEGAKSVMEANGLETALIVSDPLHMKRAMFLAKDLGIDAYSSPTPTSLYVSEETQVPFMWREVLVYEFYRIGRHFGLSQAMLSKIHF